MFDSGLLDFEWMKKKKIRNWAVLRSFRFWGKKQRFQTTTAN